jgi:hypothetical protein
MNIHISSVWIAVGKGRAVATECRIWAVSHSACGVHLMGSFDHRFKFVVCPSVLEVSI